MNQIYIGKVVSTHGIKGEIRILSDFPYKKKAFRVGSTLWIKDNAYEICSYRVHKNYDMVTLRGLENINDVLFLLKEKVYKEKEELELEREEYLEEEILSFRVITDQKEIGEIKEIFSASPQNKIMRVKLGDREVLVPFQKAFIKEIDPEQKQIVIHLVDGM